MQHLFPNRGLFFLLHAIQTCSQNRHRILRITLCDQEIRVSKNELCTIAEPRKPFRVESLRPIWLPMHIELHRGYLSANTSILTSLRHQFPAWVHFHGTLEERAHRRCSLLSLCELQVHHPDGATRTLPGCSLELLDALIHHLVFLVEITACKPQQHTVWNDANRFFQNRHRSLFVKLGLVFRKRYPNIGTETECGQTTQIGQMDLMVQLILRQSHRIRLFVSTVNSNYHTKLNCSNPVLDLSLSIPIDLMKRKIVQCDELPSIISSLVPENAQRNRKEVLFCG